MMHEDDDYVDIYEDALLDNNMEEIEEQVMLTLEEVENLDSEHFADRLAEAAGFPLLMNARYKSVGFDANTKSMVFLISGWNPL